MAKQPSTCQNVIGFDEALLEWRRCGKPAELRLGLFAVLCDECAPVIRRLLRQMWGIDQ